MLDYSNRWMRVALPADLAAGVQVRGRKGAGEGTLLTPFHGRLPPIPGLT